MVSVQHRAHGEINEAVVTRVDEGAMALEYAAPVEAVAPGQSAALYAHRRPDLLLGGGIIARTAPFTAAA